MPVPHLEGGIVRRTTGRDDFELVKFEQVGPAQLVHLRWNRQGPEGDLHQAMLFLIAWAGHQGMYVEKSRREGCIQYDVVATTRTSKGEHMTHALRLFIRGEGVDALLGGLR